MMKCKQKGEVMVIMMVVMLAVVLFSNGHMGMMGHGHSPTGTSAAAGPQKAEQALSPVSEVSPEQHS